MRLPLSLFAIALAACSTVQSRRDGTAHLEHHTQRSLADFRDCFAATTAGHDVQFLPRANGATFSSGSSHSFGRTVLWLVDIDDLGTSRRIRVHGINGATARNLAGPAVESCL